MNAKTKFPTILNRFKLDLEWIYNLKYFILLSKLVFISFNSISQVLPNSQSSPSQKPLYQSGKLYLKIKNNSNVELNKYPDNIPDSLASILNKYAVTKVEKPFEITGVRRSANSLATQKFDRIYRITFVETTKTEEFISELRAIYYIQYIEKVPAMYLQSISNDPIQPYHLNLVNANGASNIHISTGAAIIAIVDDAVLTTHEDLAANMTTNNRDVANSDNDPHPPFIGNTAVNATWFTHGTHVAGIAGGVTNNGLGIASIGWNNKIIAVKCREDSDASNSILYGFDGIKWAAENGADIINMSWGGYAYSESEYDVIVYADSLGCILVAAAGNNATLAPFYPAAYGEGLTDSTWEVLDKNLVIAVAAIDSSNNISNWYENGVWIGGSNFGNWVDIASYGTDIMSTIANSSNGSPILNQYGRANGTSMAAPIVSGLLGIMKSYKMSASANELINCLIYSANQDIYDPVLHPTNIPGNLGWGRIDAEAALRCLGVGCNNPISIIIPDSPTICPGSNISLSTNQGISYVWTTGQTTQNISVAQKGVYGVTVTFAGGCSASASYLLSESDTIARIRFVENSGLSPNDGILCGAFKLKIFASYGLSYFWNFQNSTKPYIQQYDMGNVNQSTPFTFEVTITGVGGCQNITKSVSATAIWNPLPTVTASSPVSQVCYGNPVTLDAAGADTYIWQPGNLRGNSVTIYPQYNFTVEYNQKYNVVGTESMNGCKDTAYVSILYIQPFDYNNSILVNQSNVQLSDADGDGVIRINGNMIIKAGVTYNIKNKKIEFAKDSGIIVENFATLIIENSSIKGKCQNLWNGITMDGAYGKVILHGDTIENAKKAIYVLPKNTDAFGEHLIPVVADNCTFINNQVCLELGHENYSERISKPEAILTNCKFLLNDAALPSLNHPIHFINAKNGSIIRDGGSSYENKINTLAPEQRPIAIYSPSLAVNDIEVKNESVFDGLQSAVNSYSRLIFEDNIIANSINGVIGVGSVTGARPTPIGFKGPKIVVRYNTFYKTNKGVYITASDSSEVYGNSFNNIPDASIGGADAYGVFMVGSQSFLIAANNFNSTVTGIATPSPTPNPNPATYGIVIENSSTDLGVIYNNTFTGLDFQLQTQNDNSELKIRCNYFNNPGTMSWVTFDTLRQQGNICQNPGPNNQHLAGNEWKVDNLACAGSGNKSIFVDRDNTPGGEFMYNAHEKDILQNVNITNPVNCTNLDTKPTELNVCLGLNKTALSCTSAVDGRLAPPNPPDVEWDCLNYIREVQAQINDYVREIQGAKAQIKRFDGGNKGDLIIKINQHPPLSNKNLKDLLIRSFPLSDEVMFELMKRKQPFSPDMFSDVMVSNSPLGKKVVEELIRKDPPVPPTVLKRIELAQQNQPTFLKVEDLQGLINYLDGEIQLLTRYISEASQTCETKEQWIYRLKSSSILNSKKLLVEHYRHEKKYSEAKEQLNSIQLLTDTLWWAESLEKERLIKENTNYIKLMNLLIDAESQGKSVVRIDNQGNKTTDFSQAEINVIHEVANEKIGISAKAEILLTGITGEQFDHPIKKIFSSSQTRKEKNNISEYLIKENDVFNLKIFPNPGSNLINIKVSNLEEGQDAIFKVYDILGRPVYSQYFNLDQSSTVWNTEKLKNGIYFYTYGKANELKEKGKIIILR